MTSIRQDIIEIINWEQELALLLSDLSNVQTELLELLAEKRQFMARNEIDGMLALQEREQQLGLRLQACQDRRGELLALAATQGLPHDSLENLATSLTAGKRGQVQRQIRDASLRMRTQQLQSLTNWVLAQRTMLHLAQMLEIVVTEGRPQPTHGRFDATIAAGALVDSEAWFPQVMS
jgi:hypothetical protein